VVPVIAVAVLGEPAREGEAVRWSSCRAAGSPSPRCALGPADDELAEPMSVVCLTARLTSVMALN
jgi:hypothetical protein